MDYDQSIVRMVTSGGHRAGYMESSTNKGQGDLCYPNNVFAHHIDLNNLTPTINFIFNRLYTLWITVAFFSWSQKNVLGDDRNPITAKNQTSLGLRVSAVYWRNILLCIGTLWTENEMLGASESRLNGRKVTKGLCILVHIIEVM